MDLDASTLFTEVERRNAPTFRASYLPRQGSIEAADEVKPPGPKLDFLFKYHDKMATNGYKPSYDKSYDTENIETIPSGDHYRAPEKQTFGQKVKNHYKRFWWVHLIILVGGFLLVTLLLLYVAMPKIAQSGIDDSTIELVSQRAWAPQTDRLNLHMVTISRSTSQFHPQLDAFNCSLFLEDTEPDIKPFAYIQVPRTKALSQVTITIDQVLEVADMEQFKRYNTMLLLSDTYRVGMRGKVGLHEGSMPKATVNFNKAVTSKGLNGLKGFKITNFTISLLAEADGTNLHGQVYVPNQSPLTVSMGTVKMNLFVDDEQIGTSTINDMTLQPGDNYFNMTSASDQVKVLSLITSKYKNGIVPIKIVGNSSMYNGQHLPYFEAALAANPLTAELDIGKALKAIGLDITAGGSSTTNAAALPTATS